MPGVVHRVISIAVVHDDVGFPCARGELLDLRGPSFELPPGVLVFRRRSAAVVVFRSQASMFRPRNRTTARSFEVAATTGGDRRREPLGRVDADEREVPRGRTASPLNCAPPSTTGGEIPRRSGSRAAAPCTPPGSPCSCRRPRSTAGTGTARTPLPGRIERHQRRPEPLPTSSMSSHGLRSARRSASQAIPPASPLALPLERVDLRRMLGQKRIRLAVEDEVLRRPLAPRGKIYDDVKQQGA